MSRQPGISRCLGCGVWLVTWCKPLGSLDPGMIIPDQAHAAVQGALAWISRLAGDVFPGGF